MSCASVAENIDDSLFFYKLVGIDLDNNWYEYTGSIDNLKSGDWKYSVIPISDVINYLKSFDVVFPLTHGKYGEDGRLQGFFDMFNIKYVGCGTLTSSVLMDKDISKMIFNSLKYKQVSYITLYRNYNLDEVLDCISFPMIVKPANGGSSIGINKVNDIKELKKCIDSAFNYDDKVIVEKFINARELEVAILEDEDIVVSDVGEIKTSSEYYDYRAKYIDDNSETCIADIPESVSNEIKKMAKDVFIRLGLSGYSRIDFFYDGDIYINEINTIPGFTDISMFPKLLMEMKYSYSDIITKIINKALR